MLSLLLAIFNVYPNSNEEHDSLLKSDFAGIYKLKVLLQTELTLEVRCYYGYNYCKMKVKYVMLALFTDF